MKCEKHEVEMVPITNEAGDAVVSEECGYCKRGIPQYHPIQSDEVVRAPNVHSVVAMRAYEVYCEVHRPQEAMVTGHWAKRVDEGLRHFIPKR